MTHATTGLHHVSAVSGDAQANVDFYTRVLGLHLVKRTVNFDDKFSYHLYYGDREATPGTLVTFFPYPYGEDGRVGRPQPSALALSIPRGSAGYWHDRLREHDVDVDAPGERFGDRVVTFRDGDGQPLELVESDGPRDPIAAGDVPAEHGIRGIHSVTLLSASVFHTASTLEVLGFELDDQEGDRVRYRVPGETAAVVDLLDVEAEYGREGKGTIHHVAFGAGDHDLEDWKAFLDEAGLEPTYVKDRHYFSSVYAREPGGLLFEVANDDPGFTVDEPVGELGSSLQLPPWFEADREMIESQLPELDLPER